MHIDFQSKRWIIMTSAVIFLLCTLFHFLYDLTQHNFYLGLFIPINESIFEHLKMIPLPFLLCWTLSYRFFQDKITRNSWFFGALIAQFIAIMIVILLYYTYTGMFGCESVIIDIAILAIAILFAQWSGYCILQQPKAPSLSVSLTLYFLIIIIFAALTLFPPQIPFFIDPSIPNNLK